MPQCVENVLHRFTRKDDLVTLTLTCRAVPDSAEIEAHHLHSCSSPRAGEIHPQTRRAGVIDHAGIE
jgi:hypothetical protein